MCSIDFEQLKKSTNEYLSITEPTSQKWNFLINEVACVLIEPNGSVLIKNKQRRPMVKELLLAYNIKQNWRCTF